MDETMQHIADKLKMNAAIVGLFKDGITVEQLKHYIANAPIENLYEYAQKIPEGMATGTGDEPPKQGYFFKATALTDEELRANPTLLYAKPTEFKAKDMSGGGIVESPANFIGNPDSIEFVAPLKALDDFLTGRLTVKVEEIKPLKKLHDKVMKGEIKFKPTE